jgi:hypothetical protein
VDAEKSHADHAGQWAELAAPLFERASALGGRVVGWGTQSVTVDFSWDALYDALDFLVDAPQLPELACGLCHGELRLVFESSRIALATGQPIALAAQLAGLARPGEILVSEQLVLEAEGRLRTVGEAGSRPGRPALAARVLDPDAPLIESPLSEIPASVRVRSSWPTPSRRVHPPDAFSGPAERLAGAAEAVQRESNSTIPEALAAALRDRNHESLSSLAARAEAGPKSQVTERMSAMAQLLQGRPGDAVRRLRIAKEAAEPSGPEARCRAALALAVAFAALGRNHEAVLEGLSGLARAREAGDEKGERACARLLASLASSAGDERSAQIWTSLCP